ncbi:hypothetical protein BDC45DRAFT_81304 [Circinella umbellata]|nr:hypothetical protein BDC45DRAFT_81304 [Circinella umbellata]
MNNPLETPKLESKDNDIQIQLEQIKSFLQKQKTFIYNKKEEIQHDAEAKIQQREDEQRALDQEIVKYETYIHKHQQKLPETKEKTNQLENEVKEYRSKYQTLLQDHKTKRQMYNRLKTTLEQRKEEKDEKISKARKELYKSELKANREALQLKITGLGDFQNKFEFKCINKKYPEHIYSFVLRISEEGEYSVTECNPVLNRLDELLEQLRQDNDPYMFMKRMRNAFCDYALNNN